MSQAATTFTSIERRKNPIQHFIDDMLGFLRIMSRNRVGFAGFLVIVAMILFSLIGPLFVPLDATTKAAQIYKPSGRVSPTGEMYWLGTDFQGRDVWSQIVHGGREPLMISLLAAVISTFLSVTLGAAAAYIGGRVDDMITFATDIGLTIPTGILLIVLAGFVKLNNPLLLGVLIGVISWPFLTRAVRSQILSLKERDYIEAARSLGLNRWHIIYKELLPNMMAFIVISFTFAITNAMLNQINLILLGLIPFSGTSWPIVLFQAQSKGAIFLEATRGYIYGPILAIVIFQAAMVTMIRSLEEIFNPKLRGNV